MPPSTPAATRFWDLYFRNAFITLERTPQGYRGQAFKHPEAAAPPAGWLQKPLKEDISISRSELAEHDYAHDGRFALSRQVSLPLAEALECICNQTYPYRDPPPFSRERMASLFGHLVTLLPSPPTLADVETLVRRTVEGYTDQANHSLAALAWFLGQRGEVSSAPALVSIVRNASFAPFARKIIHFTSVDTALSSLSKVNDKASLFGLLELMHEMPEAGWRKLAPLFGRLISGAELIGMGKYGMDYFRPEFWARILEPRRSFSPTAWQVADASSLFWEIRHSAARRLPVSEAQALSALVNDEVPAVAQQARARLT